VTRRKRGELGEPDQVSTATSGQVLSAEPQTISTSPAGLAAECQQQPLVKHLDPAASLPLPVRAAWRLRIPAMTVAMARSLRSSDRPLWVQFQAIAKRQRSIVETEFAFLPRSAVPEAQAVK